MRKLSISLVLIIFFSLVFTGCAKVKSEEVIEINAVVIDKDYDAPYTITTCMYTGKTIVPIVRSYSADWDITLEYEGIIDNWDVNEDIYNQYKIGDIVKCYLTTITYNNGNIKQTLTVID